MKGKQYNILLVGASCFDGMASSMRVRNLLEPLVETGKISLSNLIYKKDNREPIGHEGRLNNINYKVISIKLVNILSIFRFIFGGISFIKNNRQKNSKNILYNYNSPDIKNILFIMYARLIGYKVIIDIIEDMNHEEHAGFMHKIRIKTSIFLFKRVRFYTDAIVAISEHLVKLSESVSRNKIPVTLIPITVNLKYFNSNAPRNKSGNLKIFYGGSFGKKDGLEYLINAFDSVNSIHPGTELILTGTGHPQDMDRIFTQIDKIQNKKNIVYKGFLSTIDYYTALNGCDIFCMTRVNSKFANAGFPFKLGEFLASGKAIIATKVGDVPLYLKNNINALLIEPDSTKELVDALTVLIENSDKRQNLGLEARKTAEQYFDSDKVSMNLFSVIKSV